MSRIARALNSSDLSHQHLDREAGTVDVDVVRSLGLTAIHRSLGVLILEAKEACAGDSPHDAARVRDLINAVFNCVRKQERRDKLKVDTHAVASLLVKEMLFPCLRCEGRGKVPFIYGPDSPATIEETPGAECPTCFGSGRGKRDYAARAKASGYPDYSHALKRFWQAVESRLIEAEWSAADERYYRAFGRNYYYGKKSK